MQNAKNPISISVAPTTRAIGKRYDDLPGTVKLMRRLWETRVIDGFEFQNLAEWRKDAPPRDEAQKRLAAWQRSAKYTTDQLAASLQQTGLPILSVHANRDVGICLCSGQKQEINRGKELIHESLSLADKVGATRCVFHLWDTWKEVFDPNLLERTLHEIASQYPRVKASVENVPTHLEGCTPFELTRRFEWITLDLQWAAMYDELDRFESVRDQIVNVHLRGQLAGSKWALDPAPFGFYQALDTIRNRWGYKGVLTMEPNKLRSGDWECLVRAMSSLRDR